MDKNEVIEGLRGLKELFREGANLQIVLDEANKYPYVCWYNK